MLGLYGERGAPPGEPCQCKKDKQTLQNHAQKIGATFVSAMGKLSLLIPRHLQGCVCPALEDFGPCQRTAVCTHAHMHNKLIFLRKNSPGLSKQVGFFTGKVAMKHEEFSRFTHDRNDSLLCFSQLPRINFSEILRSNCETLADQFRSLF